MTRVQEVAVIVVLAAVALATLIDVVSDLSYGSTFSHVAIEVAVVVLSLSGVFWLLMHLRSQHRALERIKQEIAAEKQRQSSTATVGHEDRGKMSEIIREQFKRWQLTTGEQEVALLLLKGLSFKEIAGVRDTHEKTVRQQASAIYKKADVSGRHAFAAWFIEDFL